MHRIFQRSILAAVVYCVLAACSVISAGATPQSGPPPACAGGAALNGWYGILVQGGSTGGGGGKYLSGAVNFDGNCNVTGTNLSGGISGQVTSTSVTGTYGQNSDGTYNLTLNLAGQATPQTYTIGVAASGTKAVGLESDTTAVAVIDIESQLTNLTNGYSTSSLSGYYSVSCFGSGSDLNYFTFDGKGNLTGVNPYDNNGSQGNNPYSGTYVVNPDGTFSGALAGSYSQFTFTGVIDNGISEIQYTYDQAGSGGVVACSGRQAPPAVLFGYYGMVVGGKSTNGVSGQKELTASVYFDGSGMLTATNVQGGINSQYGNTNATGTYSTNSDNTVTLNLQLASDTTPQTYIVAVSEGGNEAVGIETDGTAQATIDLQSQLVPNGSSYSNSSLNGTYAANCNGAEVDLNYVTFDGNGNQNGVDPYDNGTYGVGPYTGTYAVNADGTFSGGFSGAYANYQMTGVIDNATSEIEFTYNYIGSGSVVSCVGYSSYGPVGPNPAAATPTLNPAPGSYSTNQMVTIASATPGAKIYYTTNGVMPTSSSLLYTSPVAVVPTTTIEAIAVATNYNNSAIAAGTYFSGSGTTQTAATPTFNPAPGTYNSAQTVALSDSTTGAVLHCTVDGTTPTASSPVCTTLTVSSTTTIEALAVATGYNNSAVATGVYTITPTAATPTFSPSPGTYNSTQTVTLSDTTAGAVIHCTTNGTTPTASSPVCTTLTVSSTTTIEALAVATGYNNSAVATGVYTITPTAATPTFSPSPGTYNSTQTVTLSDTTAGAVIHCTTNGTTPTASSPVCTTLTVSSTTTIEALAVATGYNNSAVATGVYTITPTAATPTFSPSPGTYNSTQTVTLSDTTAGAVIHCTTNGTTPTASSPVCTTLTVSSTTTIEALAVATGYNNSAVATGVYTITPTAATPTFSPSPGTYNSTQTVTLSDTTAGAVIHCTTNGTTPTASSPVCTTLTVSSTTTIEALAVATGYNNSAVATGVYTITPTAATPTFSPSPGTYNSTQTVTLSDTTAGAVIHCTTNGTTPTASSPVCTTLTVSSTTTIEALAVATGYNNSAVATGVYTITPTAATPTFSPSPGTYNSTQTVTLSDTTAGAVIHCTTNGTTPTASSPVCTTLTVSSTTTIEALAVATGFNNSAVGTGVYTITSSGTVVTLSSYYNVYGIATSGNAPRNGGFDNHGYAYNSGLLGTSLKYQGLSFTLGAANAGDAVNSKTISVTQGQYTQLYLLGAAVNGAQSNQTITATYTDGSKNTFKQNISDWTIPKSYSGETTVIQTANRITPSGSTQNGTVDVYGYTFTLNSSKTLSSVTLPNNRNVVFLGVGLFGTTGGPNLIANGTYVITSVNSGLAIDDPSFSKQAGKDMQQYTVNNGTNQQWTVNNLGSNVITLTSVASNMVLEVAGASKSNSALVDQNVSSGATNQQWSVIALAGGAYELINVNSGLALDVNGGGKAVGELIDQYPYQGNAWQQWKFSVPSPTVVGGGTRRLPVHRPAGNVPSPGAEPGSHDR